MVRSPVLHSLFSISIASMLLVFTLSAPALTSFAAKTLIEVISLSMYSPYNLFLCKARTSFNCSRYMEIRMLVLDSLKIVTINVLFRFFFIVHADKGFVVGKSWGNKCMRYFRLPENSTRDWPMASTQS